MTLGPVMTGLTGLELTSEEQEILQHPQIGGIVLLERNYQSPEQLQNLMRQIRQASHTHLIVAVDHEGGRIQRFRAGFTELPALRQIGKVYQDSPTQAKDLARHAGWLMAAELLAFGIDLSFAPVLDLDKGVSEVIGTRSFHREAEIVIDLAKAYISGMHQAGMAAVGKHFPGHGSIAADSHIEIPIDDRTYEEIMADDNLPFAELSKNAVEGVMPAHVIYEKVDSNPAGFSPFWLQTVLRERLGFQGAIFSDDLHMEAAQVIGDAVERARQALQAGCDSILICNSQTDTCRVLENLEQRAIKKENFTAQRLKKFIGRGTLSRQELPQSLAWQTAVAAIQTA